MVSLGHNEFWPDMVSLGHNELIILLFQTEPDLNLQHY